MAGIYRSMITFIVGIILLVWGSFHFIKDCLIPHMASMRGGN